MNSLITILICTTFLYSSTQALQCSTGDPCGYANSNYYTLANGYQCIQEGPNDVICTCPYGMERNRHCDICARSNPTLNVCQNTNGRLQMCLKTTDFGLTYACLCSDRAGGTFLTSDPNCNEWVTITPRPTTTAPGGTTQCSNGGVFVNGFCNCPSGFTGSICSVKNDPELCDRVVCLNSGTCAIRNENGPYEAVCLCRYGTWGEYCELTGTLGFCSANPCLNGGACKENVIGSTRHAYCRCPAGYNGPKCENQYFKCTDPGKFIDQPMFTQGKYFECKMVDGVLRIEQKSCARGLRFNQNIRSCTY